MPATTRQKPRILHGDLSPTIMLMMRTFRRDVFCRGWLSSRRARFNKILCGKREDSMAIDWCFGRFYGNRLWIGDIKWGFFFWDVFFNQFFIIQCLLRNIQIYIIYKLSYGAPTHCCRGLFGPWSCHIFTRPGRLNRPGARREELFSYGTASVEI